MRRLQSRFSYFLVIALLVTPLAPASSATIKAGQTCTKQNQQSKSGSKTFVCKKSGNKFVWRLKTKPTKPTPITPAPIVESKKLAVYTGGAGGTLGKSFDIPVPLAPPPATVNLKLWVYDPSNPNRALLSPGIWAKQDGGNWVWYSALPVNGQLNGTIHVELAPGRYVFDVVEPNADYGRVTYSVTIDNTGRPIMKGLQPNAAGYFTVTVTDKRINQTIFNPTSSCQLAERGMNPGMNVGFPKSNERLTSNGVVRALIVPIDFATVPGVGEPAEVFYQMATQMETYFKEMSNNRVSFDFKVLKDWQRADFNPTDFKLGSWNGGDSSGYFQAALAVADPVVDYSLFDVVYVFSPKAIPSSVIAYGPAFPTSFRTEDGPVRNGTISGADAYRDGDRTGWRWMAHETGHLFGIYDLYTIDTPSVYGDWDIMSNNWGDTLELNSWNRYTQGWLTDSQIRCLELNQLTTPVEITINPLNQRNTDMKAAMIRLSDTEILVAEVRRNGGYDKFNSMHEGVLVYKVDLTVPSIKGGYQVQRRPGSVQPNFLDALLKRGDKLRVGNVQIEVISTGANGDVIRISN